MNGGRDNSRRVWNALRYGSIGIVNDTGVVQTAQVQTSYLETVPSATVVQHFGLASNPPANADAVLLSPNGDPTTAVVIGTNHQQFRPKGQNSGETTLYNAFGITISLGQAGITINGGGLPIAITNSPTLTHNGDLQVTGEITAGFGTGDSVTVQKHVHPSNGQPPTPGT